MSMTRRADLHPVLDAIRSGPTSRRSRRVRTWPELLETGSVKRYEYALGLVPG
ncbi:hypothetical protein [Streptomyces sp. MB09-02B]|uniref:hypothetical protein n=1 Tax=Streptomyces sp. MB09-02B TaxID=3028667 RepID=UPI0029A602E6|nr:hypothetical protein [Streptomyces sp. MB09-02B]MDX3639187.1 hypothetical protein [Streptomyces sp. MB09-02B]